MPALRDPRLMVDGQRAADLQPPLSRRPFDPPQQGAGDSARQSGGGHAAAGTMPRALPPQAFLNPQPPAPDWGAAWDLSDTVFDEPPAASPSAVYAAPSPEPPQTAADVGQWTSPEAVLRPATMYYGVAPVEPARHDPSPSRVAYRLQRLWLTPTVRRGVTLGLPVLALALGLVVWLGDDTRRAAVAQSVADLRLGFENRPEFQVNRLNVQSESPEVAVAISQRLGLELPVSSFHLDLEALRRQVEALDAVESAALRLRTGGVLEVAVLEREPAMIWRHHGGLELVDAEGVRVARLAERDARADLPLIAGEGAPAAIAEAQQILAAAGPLQDRLRGLVRVGERRWDLVLDRGQRIQLPARGALPALERVLALHSVQDLLARDVQSVDLRDPTRPTIRLSQTAMAELHRMRHQANGVSNR